MAVFNLYCYFCFSEVIHLANHHLIKNSSHLISWESSSYQCSVDFPVLVSTSVETPMLELSGSCNFSGSCIRGKKNVYAYWNFLLWGFSNVCNLHRASKGVSQTEMTVIPAWETRFSFISLSPSTKPFFFSVSEDYLATIHCGKIKKITIFHRK
jgi:hypothetical protein